jgi:hypothetical protein
MIMSYLICENCGGYYELQDGESKDDFDGCHCGGRLNCTSSLNTVFHDEEYQPKEENSIIQTTMTCPVCGHLNKKTSLLCSNCNSFTRRRNNTTNTSTNNFSDRYNYQNVLESYGANARGWKGLLKKINWWGVIMGIIFLIVAWIFTSIVLVLGLIHVALQNPSEQGVLTFFGGSMLIFVLVFVASGFVAVATTKSKTYPEGIINGGLVGGIVGFFLGAFGGLIAVTVAADAGLVSIFLIIPLMLWYILLYGALTASGGILAILVRRHVGII